MCKMLTPADRFCMHSIPLNSASLDDRWFSVRHAGILSVDKYSREPNVRPGGGGGREGTL